MTPDSLIPAAVAFGALTESDLFHLVLAGLLFTDFVVVFVAAWGAS
jgi:hypothetical protein